MTRISLTLIVLIGLAPPARADAGTISLTGEFTSFTSWMLDPTVRPAAVNGIPLALGGGPAVGENGANDFYLSQTILLAAGTTQLDFRYDGAPNLQNTVQFIPVAPVDVNAGDEFLTGTFMFTNGLWFPQVDIGFRLTTHSTDAALDGHVFAGTLRVVSVAGDGTDAVAEADYFYFLERPDLGSCRVYDLAFQPTGSPGNVGGCELFAQIGSLIATEFVAANAAAFTNGSITADLAQPVPEPATLLLVVGGLAAAATRRRAQRLHRSPGLTSSHEVDRAGRR